ncbi:MAG TPA: hypothetical protein VME92_10425 [Acetobacteraceae bacterium]|nr:hypothetical protein [Acetobacteraceae bacterium]
MYFPPYARLSQCMQVAADGQTVTMPMEVLKLLVRNAAANGLMDQAWYAGAYRDVAEAIRGGRILDALSHFSEAGYFEGRRPRIFKVNEPWYTRRYTDVAASISSGKIASAHTHYNANGYYEGRAPGPEALEEVDTWNRVIDKHAAVSSPVTPSAAAPSVAAPSSAAASAAPSSAAASSESG